MWPWELRNQLNRIEKKIDLLTKEIKMADVNIDQLLADATNETTVIGSIQSAVAALQVELAKALSGVSIPPDVQVKMNSLFDTMTSNDTALANALASGTPVTPAQLTASK